MHKRIDHWYKDQLALQRFYSQLQKNNSVTQLTITNHTDTSRKVTLWDANGCPPISDPLFLEQTFVDTISVANAPQAIGYNPFNDSFYIVNQLSDSVSVINSETQVTTISLGNTVIPGEKSPVALAINTLENDPNYGEVAIACSISNELIILNTALEIDRIESTGIRPVDVVFNPLDSCFYSTDLISNTITKACPLRRVNNLPQVARPSQITVSPTTGDLFVFSENEQVLIFDLQGDPVGSFNTPQTKEVRFLFHPQQNQLYIAYIDIKEVHRIDPTTFNRIEVISIPPDISDIIYNPFDNRVYLSSRSEKTIVPLEDTTSIETPFASSGIAISSKENILALSHTLQNSVSLIRNRQSPTVTINREYPEYREDFQHNPTLITHVKIVPSTNDPLTVLRIDDTSVTGSVTTKELSLQNYISPQHFMSVYEIFDLCGDIIDGHIRWCLFLPPNQRITILIYHKQFQMYNILP